MSKYRERFSTFENFQLIEIITKSHEYNEEAVAAAQAELDSRNIPEEELAAETNSIQAELDQIQEKKEFNESLGQSILDSVNPIVKTKPTKEKYILYITLAYTFFSLYQFYHFWPLLTILYNPDFFVFDFYTAITSVYIFIPPIATALFWQRYKAGWVLIVGYATLTVLTTAISAYLMGSLGLEYVDLQSLIINLSLHGVSLFILIKPEYLEKFNVLRSDLNKTVIVSSIIGLLIGFGAIF